MDIDFVHAWRVQRGNKSFVTDTDTTRLLDSVVQD